MRSVRQFSSSEEKFLVERLKREWEEAERAAKRHGATGRAGRALTTFLLTLGLLGGVTLVAAVAPNTFAAYGKLFGKERKQYFGREEFKRQFRYLRVKKYVATERMDHGYRIFITKRGKNVLLREIAQRLRISATGEWDGTWWIVMFDIPRRHNGARNALRARLKALGMEALQNSVFISRYPCREEVRFTAQLLNVARYVQIAHVDSLEGYR